MEGTTTNSGINSEWGGYASRLAGDEAWPISGCPLSVLYLARTEDVTIIESDKIEGVHFSLSVDYENLSIKRAADIQDLIDRNIAIFRQILNSELLTGAINGVRESDYSDYKYRDFLLAKGLL
jgi:hypothetical protein